LASDVFAPFFCLFEIFMAQAAKIAVGSHKAGLAHK